jgi:hypothetical protein
VVTVKLADVCPPGTVTMPGTLATDKLLVARVTEIPPAGAGELRNTVPVAAGPPGHARGGNRHRLQQGRRIRVCTYVNKN